MIQKSANMIEVIVACAIELLTNSKKLEMLFALTEIILQKFTIWMGVTTMIAKILLKTFKELEMEYVIGIITIQKSAIIMEVIVARATEFMSTSVN